MGNTIYNYHNLKNEYDKRALEHLLIDLGYTYRELQGLYKYNERLWSRLAKEYGIPKQEHNIRRNIYKRCKLKLPIARIISMYVDEEASLREISKKFGVTHSTIARTLRENDIDIRPYNYSKYYEGRKVTTNGTIGKDSSGYATQYGNRQHRNIMRSLLDRPLTSTDVIHHLDGDKSNNDIDNLFVFPDNRCHMLFHGQQWTSDPSEFVKYYKDILVNTLYNKEWLYGKYMNEGKSVASIARELRVSRGVVTKNLRKFGIYELRPRNVN